MVAEKERQRCPATEKWMRSTRGSPSRKEEKIWEVVDGGDKDERESREGGGRSGSDVGVWQQRVKKERRKASSATAPFDDGGGQGYGSRSGDGGGWRSRRRGEAAEKMKQSWRWSSAKEKPATSSMEDGEGWYSGEDEAEEEGRKAMGNSGKARGDGDEGKEEAPALDKGGDGDEGKEVAPTLDKGGDDGDAGARQGIPARSAADSKL